MERRRGVRKRTSSEKEGEREKGSKDEDEGRGVKMNG